MGAEATGCVWRSEGNLLNSFLPLHEFQELNSGDDAWQQLALPTGLHPRPRLTFYKSVCIFQ